LRAPERRGEQRVASAIARRHRHAQPPRQRAGSGGRRRGSSGAAGVGRCLRPFGLSAPTALGLRLCVQAAVIDDGAPAWFSLTNGLEVVVTN
jgi:hypothetical protein